MEHNCGEGAVLEVKEKTGLYPLGAGEEVCKKGHCWGPGVRGHYLIHYVIRGKGSYYCGVNRYELTAGDLFVIYPGTVIQYRADEEDPWHYAWTVFLGDEAYGILEAAGITPLHPVAKGLTGEQLLSLLRRMPRMRSQETAENLHATSLLYEFMSLLTGEKQGQAQDSPYFVAAKRYVRSRYSQELTVEELARAVGVSRKYLYTLFKDACGKSPKEYLLDYRMEKAAAYLVQTDLSVGTVSNSVGYTDPLLFSKMFKKKMGLSPKQYRESRK